MAIDGAGKTAGRIPRPAPRTGAGCCEHRLSRTKLKRKEARMKSLHRVLVTVAACCAAAAVLVPVAALAHGRGRDRTSPSGGGDSQQICRDVRGYRDSGLSDMQIRELSIACQ